MAPTPVEENNNLIADPTTTPKPNEGYWTKSNIAVTIVFALLALVFLVLLLAFYFRRRSHKKQLAHLKSDKAGLLANEDKTSMFSSTRHSSVTVYVDEEGNKQTTQEGVSLVPLRSTPVEEVQNPVDTPTATTSIGSGVSAMSRLSTNTASTMMLSPISPNGEEGDLSVRQYGRPRSTSTTSQKARFYETTPTNPASVQIPIIVRTLSD
jgi:hypothetical protein